MTFFWQKYIKDHYKVISCHQKKYQENYMWAATQSNWFDIHKVIHYNIDLLQYSVEVSNILVVSISECSQKMLHKLIHLSANMIF